MVHDLDESVMGFTPLSQSTKPYPQPGVIPSQSFSDYTVIAYKGGFFQRYGRLVYLLAVVAIYGAVLFPFVLTSYDASMQLIISLAYFAAFGILYLFVVAPALNPSIGGGSV